MFESLWIKGPPRACQHAEFVAASRCPVYSFHKSGGKRTAPIHFSRSVFPPLFQLALRSFAGVNESTAADFETYHMPGPATLRRKL